MAAEGEYIDVFFFDTLSPQPLDCYQRLREGDLRYAVSSVGPKRVAVISTHSKDSVDWSHIRTYSDLCKYSFSLKADSPLQPLAAAEAILPDGLSRVADLKMKTRLAKVVLNSLACDFSDTPYPGYGFTNTLVYLQYAGVEIRPLGPYSDVPLSFVNQGWLDSAAVMALPHPEMLLQEGVGHLWRNKIVSPKEFWCYCNDVKSASLGSPVTRIVLEGDVGDYHCYYPIDLPGLKGASTVSLDVTLLRMGSPDPDIPVNSAAIKVQTLISPWEMEEERVILY